MEQSADSKQIVHEQDVFNIISEQEIEGDGNYSQGYNNLLKSCYKNMLDSRLVKHRDTDLEALSYFNQLCNRTIPRTDSEKEIKNMFREMYYGDKTSYLSCINKTPHLVLLTEARAIVLHFGIFDIIYIEWKDDQYIVSKNDYYEYPRQDRKSSKFRSGLPKYKKKEYHNAPRNVENRGYRGNSKYVDKHEKHEKYEKHDKRDDVIQDLNERIKKLEQKEKNKKIAKSDKKIPNSESSKSPSIPMENIFDNLRGSSESWGDMADD
jgi:hypothetical protein